MTLAALIGSHDPTESEAIDGAAEAMMIAILKHRDPLGRAMMHDKQFDDLAARAKKSVRDLIAYAYDGR